MALIIYPSDGADSFISLADATTVITENSLQASQWTALTDANKEIYLRIAYTNITNAISYDLEDLNGFLDPLTYDAEYSCLPKSQAIMAINDIVYQISAEINPSTGLISKEKVGDLEVTYFHGANTSSKQLSSKNKNPFPSSVVKCLTAYGATISTSGFTQSKLERS